MAEDLIRYDVLVQEALRGVVRKVLTEVAQAGLPGDHHIFISFDPSAPGVRISSRLKQKYPEELTIVLQHQYWDLNVGEQGFEVGLSFGGAPERLVVPYTAIKGFFDPSVQFGLQFEPVQAEAETADEADQAEAVVPAPEIVAEPAKPALPAGADEGGAAVVSLDAFRKRT